jgi:hypothetical protein
MFARKIHEVPTTWFIIFIVLSTAPELRLGDVQILELLQLLRVLMIVLLFAYTGLRFPAMGVWRQCGPGYIGLIAAMLVLSLVALRLPFFPPSDISFLKEPFVLSLSRILELCLVIYFMLAIADMLQDRPRLFRIALDVYTGAGAVSALASVIAFAIFQFTGQYTYFINDLDHRVRGLFNEGGPYGLFLTSVILVLLMRRRLYPDGSRLIRWTAFAVTLMAWFLSFSKAGLLAGMLCAMAGALRFGFRKRILAAITMPIVCAALFVLFQRGFVGYMNNISNFDETVLFRPHDRNLVMGRIVATFVIPRMIAAHPLLGIGLGNYSLMRNDPEYLQGLPAIDDWDLPGLGLVSDAAELGVPLTLAFIVLLVRPLWNSKKQSAPAIVLATAAFQPVALLTGVNLNFFYPWLVSAFVLAWLGQQGRVQHVIATKPSSRYRFFLPKQVTL